MFTRDPHNPVLLPRAGLDEAAVFNPGAVVLDGTLFLIPRVRRLSTRESFFGLAWATQPGDPWQRLDHPIMVGSAPYERPMLGRPRETGGVEDCRVTVIGHQLFLVYTAFHRRCHRDLTKLPRPVLSPEMEYEVDVSDWLANDAIRVAAVFACGMVRWGGQVLVPYGAGDHQVCLGTLDPGPLSTDSRRFRR